GRWREGRMRGTSLLVQWVVYLSPADKYHRLTRRLSQRAKRPKRESSHGLSAALSPLVTPSQPAVRTHVAGSGSLSLPLPTTGACQSPRGRGHGGPAKREPLRGGPDVLSQPRRHRGRTGPPRLGRADALGGFRLRERLAQAGMGQTEIIVDLR